ncbi:MAG: SDR family oxidoreductase [Anaerolineae bacterium]
MANEMQGKTVLISGATNGIGLVTARELAKMGAEVVVVGRSKAKTEETVRKILTVSGHQQVHGLVADLSLMSEVRRVAQEFNQRFPRLDVLINNAGAMFAERRETAEGNEMTLALNHLNYFLLTHLLLDKLKSSTPARIVSVSSDAHRTLPLKLDDLQSRKNYGMGGLGAYSQSKLMNVMFTYELARRLRGTGATANVLHPGFVATGFARNNGGLMSLVMKAISVFAISPQEGAKTSIYLASSPEVEGVSGKYFEKCKAVPSLPAAYDEAAQRQLWTISEQLVGLTAAV